jgi:Holliday junction resolvase RusA-like endonuclease
MSKRFTDSDLKKLGMEETSPGLYVKKEAEPKHIAYAMFGEHTSVKYGVMDLSLVISFPVDPIGKPRMTSSDKWKKRPATDRYWEMKDRLKLIAKGKNFVIPESGFHIIAYLPMPDSWSKKKKEEMDGKPHKAKPDGDNICKAIFDSLCEEDSYIWDFRMTKYWAYKGRIDIHTI